MSLLLVWHVLCRIVIGVVIVRVALSSLSSSPLQDGTTGRGDGTRWHEEWVAQIERAARVRIGQVNKLDAIVALWWGRHRRRGGGIVMPGPGCRRGVAASSLSSWRWWWFANAIAAAASSLLRRLLMESMACAYVITYLGFCSFSFPHLSDLSGY